MRDRIHEGVGAALGGALLLLASSPLRADGIPLRLGPVEAENGSAPAIEWVWESAASFLDADGTWHLERLPESALLDIDSFVSRQASGAPMPDCIRFGQPIPDPVPDRLLGPRSLQERIDQASDVVSGTVAAKGPGFLWGYPVELVGIRVERWLRSEVPATSPRPETIYVGYPKVRMTVGRYTWCRDPDDRLPEAPEIGEKVLFVTLTGAVETAPDLFDLSWTDADLFWNRSDGGGLAFTGFLDLSAGVLDGYTGLESLSQAVGEAVDSPGGAAQ